jgi:hypothetical protein
MATTLTENEIVSLVIIEWAKEGIGGLPIAVQEVAEANNLGHQSVYDIVNKARVNIVMDRKNGYHSIAFALKIQPA